MKAMTNDLLRPAVPPRSSPGTIVLVSASIGAGHDGAARELARRLIMAGFTVRHQDFLDLLPPGWGDSAREAYARQLRYAPASWGWLLRAAGGRRASAGAAALAAGVTGARLLETIGPGQPAAIVSTYPLASQVLGRLRRSGRLAAPAVAYMTDPAVHRLCVAPGVDLHIAPGRWAADAIRDLHPVHAAVAGPVVHPAFQPGRGESDVDEARRRLGLPLGERLAVVVAGSWGVGDVERTVRDIVAAGSAIPVVVCGRNEPLRRRLGLTRDTIALGWVEDMPSLLRTADVVVHNAGGLSSLEAMASGAAVVSYRCLPGHGTANAAVLRAAGLSPWPQSPAELAGFMAHAFDGDLRQRQNAAYAKLASAPDAASLIIALTGARATAPTTLDVVV